MAIDSTPLRILNQATTEANPLPTETPNYRLPHNQLCGSAATFRSAGRTQPRIKKRVDSSKQINPLLFIMLER